MYSKPYMVFTYYAGRPLGGMKDYLDSFDSIEEALDNLLKEKDRYYQIVETENFEIVREGLTLYKDFSAEGFEEDGMFEGEDDPSEPW